MSGNYNLIPLGGPVDQILNPGQWREAELDIRGETMPLTRGVNDLGRTIRISSGYGIRHGPTSIYGPNPRIQQANRFHRAQRSWENAITIQRAFRGHIGRSIYVTERKLMNEYGEARLAQMHREYAKSKKRKRKSAAGGSRKK